ncbi:penicillin acylase family protein [Saccharopolyspora shandongensis]|uniref:penicillin acylase family protein n=1 Tax=Saccharopolyspora shandongensis TaxID=418495 RepID=UPI00341E7B28
MPRRSRTLAALSAAAVVGSLVLAPASTAEPIPEPAPDYCGQQCHHILPPGQNGNATFAELVAHMLLGTRPPHSDDQLAKYDRLAGGYRELTTGTIDDFFNDNSFGVRPDDVERTYRPREDVTIVRDKTAGIPHVYGTTRSGTAYGAGYATAEDKLFLMDAMRRAGRGEVTPFAGGAPANRQLEQQFFAVSPYTEQELQQQIDTVARHGERGRQALEDAKSYVDGINEYIEKSYNGRYFPGEYVATGHVDPITNAGRIEPFRLTDLVVLASLVGAQFGGGGGNEVQNAVARMSLHERFGPERGEQIWAAFRAENDPEAISTIHDGRSFPYGGTPADPRGVVLPDPGSVSAQQLIFDPTGSAVEAAEPATRPESSNPPPTTDDPVESLRGIFDDGVVPGGMGQARGMSNALVVSGAHTESGHPVAVFGPQTGYFSPQLLTLQELQGPGISSKGASFAGLSFYTLLGRGQDYAWSATTAAQDMIDSYAVELCEPDGRPVTKDSNFYRFRGECLPMQTVERKNAWQPNLGDNTPQGSYRLVSFRTRYGPVTHRATVDGKPVAFAQARSTFLHEVDSIIGFQKFNDPGAITSAADFQRAAHDVNYTFNWFYADATDTAYFNSGANVVRKPDVDPSMPIAGDPAFEWQGWNPADNTAAYAPFDEHPNSINQDYYISWNNKQAPGTAGAKAEKGAVQRGDLLDRRVAEHIAAGGKFDRVTLTQAMADAGVTDLRAERVLPDLLRLIDGQPITDPETAALVDRLRAWLADGGRRVETSPGSKEYAHAEAIELLDAWWPRLVRGEFEPAVGADAYQAMTDMMQINESPSGWQNGEPGLHVGQGHQGSAFQYGWFGQVSKDIRAVLGEPVPGGFGEPLCGGGDAGACRQMLLDTLRQAAEAPATDTYPGDADCEPGDQWCADAILQTKIGGISQQKISWQNRPTYQQVVEFPTHR